ncbi:MAG: calcium-binding protein [Actinomycetota bacterium]
MNFIAVVASFLGGSIWVASPAAAACNYSDPPNIYGTQYADDCNGTPNRDVMYAGTGADFFKGFAGPDSILGEGGNDTLFGNDGNDLVYGEGGNDAICGTWHDDYVQDSAIGQDWDHLSDGAGNDQIFMSDGDGDDHWHNEPDGQAEVAISQDPGDTIANNTTCHS